jgi:hypothetical protein
MGLLDNASKPLRQATRVGRWAAGRGLGGAMEVRRRVTGGKPKDFNDPTIARKVETEVFRSRSVPKGSIDVNVVDGVVYLRGTAKNEAQLKQIETKVRAVPEVVDVQNLLHLPKTPAPTRADTPRRQQRTRSKPTPPDAPRVEPREINADKTSPRTGESPEELAEEGKGRQPAPLGTEE